MPDYCMALDKQQVAELQCDVQSLEVKRDSLLQHLRSAQEELRQLHTDNGTMIREQRTAQVSAMSHYTCSSSHKQYFVTVTLQYSMSGVRVSLSTAP
jgi:replicative DNA helicase